MLTNRNITRFKQLTVQTNRKRESKFRCAGKYLLPYLIMSIVTERFLAVCPPVIYRRHKLRHSTFIHLLTFVMPGLLLAMLLNIPKFMELELVMRPTTGDDYTGPAIDYQATSLTTSSTTFTGQDYC